MIANRTVFTFLACLCLSLSCSDSMAQEDEGLGVLNHYVGVWDCRFAVKSRTGDVGEPQQFTGVVEAKWVVGDRFLEQVGRYRLGPDSEPLIIKTIISHDDQQNQYRFDYYNSDGSRYDGQGEWSAGNKTMTSRLVMESSGDATTIVADFSTPDVEEWPIRTSNAEGKTVLEINGVNTRRKGPEKKQKENRE